MAVPGDAKCGDAGHGEARAENSVMDGVLSIAMRLAFVAWQCYASHGNARFSGARADNGRQRRLRLPFFFWEMNDR